MGFITLIQALCQQSFGLSLPQNCAFFGWAKRYHCGPVFVQTFPCPNDPSSEFLEPEVGNEIYGTTLRLRLRDFGPASLNEGRF